MDLRYEPTTAELTPKDVLEQLRSHRLLGEAPSRELAWLASHGELRRMKTGEILTSRAKGPIEELYILLTGRVGMYHVNGGVERKIIEWSSGDITGLLPYSRLRLPPGVGRVEEPTELFVVHGRHLEDLTRECHFVTTVCVRVMLDRARHFQKEDLHLARMASLGRLAAGLAHELDNPASAIVRGAKLLVSRLQEADLAARRLGELGMSAAQLEAAERLRDHCLASPLQQIRSPLEQGRHEEAIADWLAHQGVQLEDYEPLAETGLTVEMLDDLVAAVGPQHVEPALRWIGTVCAVRTLGEEVGEAAVGISDLVKAVKGFTQMDSAPELQPVAVEQGLAQTLAVLRSKARAKSVRVSLEVEPGLRPVLGVVGELNQIWANLLENAVDAVDSGGSVAIFARAEGDAMVVDFIDDGPGIPAELREKVFEPFFTTKAVGEGTGLGLDIVRRLVDRHEGSIELTSRPGHTEFRVRLPVDAGEARSAG
jgi:signal transduction histidine kinase